MAILVPPDPDANSFASLAEADAYFVGRLHSTSWTTADTPTKEAALIWATRLIGANVCFTGSPTSDSQPLVWPRSGMTTRNGATVPSDEIPQDLINATAELAMSLITTDRTAESQTAAIGLTKLKAGPVELNFDNASAISITVPSSVTSLLPSSWLCPVVDPLAPKPPMIVVLT